MRPCALAMVLLSGCGEGADAVGGPWTVDFGQVPAGIGISSEVVLVNRCPDAVGVSVPEDAVGTFEVGASCVLCSIAPDGSLALEVTFTAPGPGTFRREVALSSSQGPVVLRLQGDAVSAGGTVPFVSLGRIELCR